MFIYLRLLPSLYESETKEFMRSSTTGLARSGTSRSVQTTSRPTMPPRAGSYGGAAAAGSPRRLVGPSGLWSPATASPVRSRPTPPRPSATGARAVAPCRRPSPTRRRAITSRRWKTKLISEAHLAAIGVAGPGRRRGIERRSQGQKGYFASPS